MALEDLERAAAGLTETQFWSRLAGAASVGFHVRHVARSVDRLLTYAEGGQLSDIQMAALRSELEPGQLSLEVLSELKAALEDAGNRVRRIAPESLYDVRGVGRRQLPTTVIGLLVHVAEHTQRHAGQALTTARLVAAEFQRAGH